MSRELSRESLLFSKVHYKLSKKIRSGCEVFSYKSEIRDLLLCSAAQKTFEISFIDSINYSIDLTCLSLKGCLIVNVFLTARSSTVSVQTYCFNHVLTPGK